MYKTLIRNILLAILALTIATGFFYLMFEKVEEEVISFPSDQAMRNPFLAAERFLNKAGIETKSTNKKEILTSLPDTDHLIFINKMGGNIPRQREDDLISWIENGGELIITHDSFFSEKRGKSGNNFLDRLEIKLYGPDQIKNKKGKDSIVDYEETEKVKAAFCRNEPAEIEFFKNRLLYDGTKEEQFENSSAIKGSHIIIQEHGKGRIIVLSDNNFLQNNEIDKHDHAYFLFKLAQKSTKVWILYSSELPSIFKLLVKNFPWFSAMFAILVLLSILRLGLRYGPVLPVNDISARNLIEHLDAAGEFSWKHDKARAMINSARSSIEKAILKKHILLSNKDKNARYKVISKITGMEPHEIDLAFNGEVTSNEELIKIVKILKRLHFDILTKKE